MSRFSANKSSGNMSSILTQEAPPPLAAPPPRAGPGEFEKALLLQGTAPQQAANGRDIHKGGISNVFAGEPVQQKAPPPRESTFLSQNEYRDYDPDRVAKMKKLAAQKRYECPSQPVSVKMSEEPAYIPQKKRGSVSLHSATSEFWSGAKTGGVQALPETWFVKSEQSQFETGDGGERLEQVCVTEDVEEGTLLLEVLRSPSSILPVPAWNTLQIGKAEHATFSSKSLCLNHSSTPNTRIEIGSTIQVYSTVYIPAGAQLTFNYNTTEWVISSPFKDWTTGTLVRGFFHLSKEDKRQLIESGEVAEHVKELWEEYVRRNVRINQEEDVI
mmetsp:Transcript_7606/g.13713  ORF Transcript_7606/g.13713 Transcript_7606/m.13713 type:complete len:329 (+) Transcript_7606:72-1058(+)